MHPRMLFPTWTGTRSFLESRLSHILPRVADPYKYLDCDWKSISHRNEGYHDMGPTIRFFLRLDSLLQEIAKKNTTCCK